MDSRVGYGETSTGDRLNVPITFLSLSCSDVMRGLPPARLRQREFFRNEVGVHVCKHQRLGELPALSCCSAGGGTSQNVGYKFRYRRQFALITVNYAKLLSRLTLCKSQLFSVTLIYHRLTAFSGNSKSVGSNSMGVRFPLPAPSNVFVCNRLQGREVSEADPSGTNTVHCASKLFSTLYGFRSMARGQPPIYIDCRYIRSITECAADKWSAHLGGKKTRAFT
jgi:hypothetical protein